VHLSCIQLFLFGQCQVVSSRQDLGFVILSPVLTTGKAAGLFFRFAGGQKRRQEQFL
jgi:hypothetical protein